MISPDLSSSSYNPGTGTGPGTGTVRIYEEYISGSFAMISKFSKIKVPYRNTKILVYFFAPEKIPSIPFCMIPKNTKIGTKET